MTGKSFDILRFKENLDACHQWPCGYVFKFIVAAEGLDELVAVVNSLVPSPDLSTRTTSNGKWVGLTVEAELESSDQVVAVYQRVAELETILTL